VASRSGHRPWDRMTTVGGRKGATCTSPLVIRSIDGDSMARAEML
uniref:Uncharacterized protein n=1 Tax=Aegilops tauschii subsp. strangulata TaxID=200361 RepID=A0A453KGX0_AEGTS